MALKNPISALYEYCAKKKIAKPFFIESSRLIDNHNYSFEVVIMDGKRFGPFSGPSKNIAKLKAAVYLCNLWKLPNSGIPMDKLKKAFPSKKKTSVALLHEFCQSNGWTTPLESVVSEIGDPHNKTFEMRYVIAGFKFPTAVGPNKDTTKRRAAARALAVITKRNVREFIRGPDPDIAFGDQVTDTAWETFGILCEEFGESVEFCKASNLCAFVLENLKDGSLRCVALGTGKSVAEPASRVCAGESVLDSHAVVVARRSLLVFFYKQLRHLLKGRPSIFKYQNDENNPKVAALRDDFRIHLYMKQPPCGAASIEIKASKKKKETMLEDVNDHTFYNVQKIEKQKLVINTEEKGDIVSCSDKIMLWNFVGLQGSLLGSFIEPLYLDSITVSQKYVTACLVHSFCCRSERKDITHTWIQRGLKKEINDAQYNNNENDDVSIYWTHGDMSLNDELENLPASGGMINGFTGTHSHGTERYGDIPMICKRYLFMLFRDVISCAGDVKTDFLTQKSYKDAKSVNRAYRVKKNEFFKHINDIGFGSYIMIDNVDDFKLD